MRAPFIRDILSRLAPRIGAMVEFHRDGFVGRVSFPNGAHSLFWDNKFNLNPVSSAKVAQDKFYTSFILESAGISVPEEQLFFRPSAASYAGKGRCGVQPAYRYAKRLGLPVFLKPNRLSQGRLVTKVHSHAEFRRAASEVFIAGRGMLVQRPAHGRDYRIIVLDGEVLSAYERRPLSVTGDGRASIRGLLKRLQREFVSDGRDTIIEVDDPRIEQRLGRSGLTLNSILAPGNQCQLMDAANLSLGGSTMDITGKLHRTFADLARQVSSAMDLRFSGVDIIAADATQPIADYIVLEVNSAPGVDNYLFTGQQNTEYVDSLYLKILQAVERGPSRRTSAVATRYKPG